jgi:transmembrane sensor
LWNFLVNTAFVRFTRLQKLIDKHLKGKTTSAETAILEHWLDTISSESRTEIPVDRKEAIRNRIQQRIQTHSLQQSEKGRVRTFTPWMPVAAAVIPLLMAGALYMGYTLRADDQITIKTGIGEQREIQLPDNSKVWLRPNSMLTYAKTFSGKRQVTLQGEAFFDVRRNPARKFSVHAGHVEVEVLGTSFDVKSYANFPTAVVAVNTGKVRVLHDAEELGTLLPNQKLEYGVQSAQVRISECIEVDPAGERLVFESATLREVLLTISNYYPITFEGKISDTIKISGAFRKDLTRSALVDVLNSVVDKYRIQIKKHTDTRYSVE